MNPNILIPSGFLTLIIILYIAKLRKEKPPIKTTIIKEIIQAPPKPKNIHKKRSHKHFITINANTNDYRYDFPIILKNVEHVEMVSAIIPKSSYRINSTNDVIPIQAYGHSGVNVKMTHGVYDTITNLQLELNRKIRMAILNPVFYFAGDVEFPARNTIIFLFNSLTRKMYIEVARDIGTNIKFLWKTEKNTCARAFGFVDDIHVNIPNTVKGIFFDVSILFQTAAYTGAVQVNNLPTDYYTDLDMFPLSPVVAGQYYVGFGEDRVNITHQIFVDVEAKELTYWGGSHIIQQVYIPEDQAIVNYQRQYPIYRRLREDRVNLDHLTISFQAIIEPGIRDPYVFNGIDYSVQLEITTNDLELNDDE